MIPDAAAEAATDALQQFALTEDRDGLQAWDAYARVALEAAAPHLIQAAKAEAWDEGRGHGARYPYGERGLATDDNPYR